MGRILMVVRPSTGGAFTHVVRLSEALLERGHEVAICGPHGEHRGRLRAEVIDIPVSRDPSPAEDLRAVRAVAAAYRSFEPDLIHAHGSKGPTFARLARFARPRTPVVFTPHNYAFRNWFASRAQRGAYLALEVALAPLATRVICVCEAERRIAARIGPARRTRTVYNGIEPFDPVVPNPLADRLAANGPLLVSVSEFQPPKGVPSLIESMPLVLERVPEANLAIAGEGFMRPQIEAQIAALGLDQRVHLLGQLPDVSGLLAAADLFVSPSWSESFPYSVLEAMSVGAPIVATDVGGVGEAIEDGVTGRLVQAQNAAALATASVELLTNRARAAELGSAARARVFERFTLERTLEGVLAVYGELGLS
jgi:glycosyltransferase involved in cell wall biosynthesis